MPNFPLSTSSLGTSPWPTKSFSASRPQEYGRDTEVESDLGPLRLQAAGIIDAVLSATDPEEADVRERLRWHVTNHPGKPEKALLGHLLSVSGEQEAS